ncbi:MAG TPA: exodeoxyribonuclease VII large subunit, partial [Candidatus Dormibacteraeota bacterium]|nr:exodeoxyribonuclease VII large subunit [Candidatus Dormibacteraeota bacterium]
LVKGEVSGMKRGPAGHYNFSIGDGYSKLEALLWADASRRVTTLPEDGQVFIFRGKIDFFAKNGRLSFVVDQVEFDDVGKLRARLEELKRRLEAEGAFDPKRKRPVPFLPHNVALLTSPTGAVINDLQETIWERYPNMGVVVYPVQVQGAGAPMSVARAMRRCNQERLADVIVLARGGGSFEEMYAFNTELVARAILESRLPVVTALGHTSDRTVADLVADAECRTPTEAGARVVPKKADLLTTLRDRKRRLHREVERRLKHESDRLARARSDIVRLSPIRQLERREQSLREHQRRLHAALTVKLKLGQARLAATGGPERITRILAARFGEQSRRLEGQRQRLVALSPQAVLTRGYSITRDAGSGTILRAATEAAVDQKITVQLGSGSLAGRIEEVEP